MRLPARRSGCWRRVLQSEQAVLDGRHVRPSWAAIGNGTLEDSWSRAGRIVWGKGVGIAGRAVVCGASPAWSTIAYTGRRLRGTPRPRSLPGRRGLYASPSRAAVPTSLPILYCCATNGVSPSGADPATVGPPRSRPASLGTGRSGRRDSLPYLLQLLVIPRGPRKLA